MMIKCPYCLQYDEILFRKLQNCPRCGANLLNRITEHNSGLNETQVDDAVFVHQVESKYDEATISRHMDPLRINAHDLLDYARLRGEIARYIETIYSKNDTVSIIGFMTGSYALCNNARLLLGEKGVGRFILVRGLSHAGNKEATQIEYHEKLYKLYDSGIKHYIIIDEMISGGQLRSALKSLQELIKLSNMDAIKVSLIGVHEGDILEAERIMNDVVIKPPRKSKWKFEIVDKIALSGNKLFEKDKEGDPFRAVITDVTGDYRIMRDWPGSIDIYCDNLLRGGANGGVCYSASSLDQVMGIIIDWILDQTKCPGSNIWPETILKAECSECRSLLNTARSTYGTYKNLINMK